MDNRTGVAILLAIVAAGLYRIVVFRRLLARLEASPGRPRPPAAVSGLVRLRPLGPAGPTQGCRNSALGRAWKVRGSDGVALDPTIEVPDKA